MTIKTSLEYLPSLRRQDPGRLRRRNPSGNRESHPGFQPTVNLWEFTQRCVALPLTR